MTYKLLNGVRVIESSAFIAAPMGGLTLAQYGADVIRVEMMAAASITCAGRSRRAGGASTGPG